MLAVLGDIESTMGGVEVQDTSDLLVPVCEKNPSKRKSVQCDLQQLHSLQSFLSKLRDKTIFANSAHTFFVKLTAHTTSWDLGGFQWFVQASSK